MYTTCGYEDSQNHHHHHHTDYAIKLENNIRVNDQYAQQNRDILAKDNNIALNFISSPRSMVRHIYLRELLKSLIVSILSQLLRGRSTYTDLYAEIIHKTGIEAYQINTGKAFHLDAHWSCF